MLQPGERLGPYEIIAPLGAGGMGEVYRARDARLKREVALKLLPAALAHDASTLARFEREAQLLAALNHPHIAAIYGFEQGALAMELVEGTALAGPMAAEEALSLAQQICEALEYAHERGIIHRDLKPGNIKVTAEGQIKLLDFGLAKALMMEASGADISNSPTLTHMATLPGVILGTAAYMAPEQAKGKPVDRRADIWAFGCVLFEMLTGVQAFRGESVTEVLAAVISQEPDWMRLPVDTPARVRKLLASCLKKDPRQRLQAIGDARITLEEQEAAPATGNVAAATQKARQPWGWIAACVALAVLAAAVYWTRPQSPEAASLRFTVGWPAGVSAGYGLALSPDGTRLVFAASENGQASLWLRRLGDLTVAPLPGTAGGQFPFWSPDGRSLGFFAGGALKRFDFSTDSVRTLCSVSGAVRAVGLGVLTAPLCSRPPSSAA